MPRIVFTAEKSIHNCDPEIVSKVQKASSLDELEELFDEYGRDEVEDTMFAIAADEEKYIDYLSEDEIEDLLWEQYSEHIFYDYICASFLKRQTKIDEINSKKEDRARNGAEITP